MLHPSIEILEPPNAKCREISHLTPLKNSSSYICLPLLICFFLVGLSFCFFYWIFKQEQLLIEILRFFIVFNTNKFNKLVIGVMVKWGTEEMVDILAILPSHLKPS